MSLKYSFEPVVSPGIRVLILGSLPGDASLAQSQYYAHPQNRFWELVGAVIAIDLRSLDYDTRLQTLLAHGIGLWDVVASAQRSGSLDSRIQNHTGNDIAGLIASLPQLKAIAFNGGTAAKHGLKQLGALAAGYEIMLLPSSSPAYTLAFDQKLQTWHSLGKFV